MTESYSFSSLSSRTRSSFKSLYFQKIEIALIALLLIGLMQLQMSTWDLILPFDLPRLIEYVLDAIPPPFAALRWLRLFVLICVGVFAISMLLLRLRDFYVLLLNNPLIVGFVAMMGASILWSLEPYYSFRGITVTWISFLFACYLRLRLQPEVFLHILHYVLLILLLLNYSFFLSGGERGADTITGALTGVYSNKNVAAFIMGLTAITFFSRMLSSFAHLRQRFFWFLIAATALFLTKSYTSILAFLICVLMVMLLAALAYRRLFALTYLIVLSLILLVIVLNFTVELLAFIGKDPTLTKRTEVWSMVLPVAIQNPILGHGYLAFWTNDRIAEGFKGAAGGGYYVHHAHNGYLDSFVYFGIVGLGWFVSLIVLRLTKFVLLYRQAGIVFGSWRVMLVAFFAMAAWSESVYNMPLLVWVLMFYAFLMMPSSAPPAPAIPRNTGLVSTSSA